MSLKNLSSLFVYCLDCWPTGDVMLKGRNIWLKTIWRTVGRAHRGVIYKIWHARECQAFKEQESIFCKCIQKMTKFGSVWKPFSSLLNNQYLPGIIAICVFVCTFLRVNMCMLIPPSILTSGTLNNRQTILNICICRGILCLLDFSRQTNNTQHHKVSDLLEDTN